MKTKIEFVYWWEDSNGKEPIDIIIDTLDNEAVFHIKKMWEEGYTSGELDYQDYSGWWELNTKRMEAQDA